MLTSNRSGRRMDLYEFGLLILFDSSADYAIKTIGSCVIGADNDNVRSSTISGVVAYYLKIIIALAICALTVA